MNSSSIPSCDGKNGSSCSVREKYPPRSGHPVTPAPISYPGGRSTTTPLLAYGGTRSPATATAAATTNADVTSASVPSEAPPHGTPSSKAGSNTDNTYRDGILIDIEQSVASGRHAPPAETKAESESTAIAPSAAPVVATSFSSVSPQPASAASVGIASSGRDLVVHNTHKKQRAKHSGGWYGGWYGGAYALGHRRFDRLQSRSAARVIRSVSTSNVLPTYTAVTSSSRGSCKLRVSASCCHALVFIVLQTVQLYSSSIFTLLYDRTLQLQCYHALIYPTSLCL